MTTWQAKLCVVSFLALGFYASNGQTPAPALEAKRVYVEPFAIKGRSDKFRADLIAELRKVKGVIIVRDRSAADAILGGDGEVWIRGYQSLNPRSGWLPYDGTPVYSGFVSVELKDVRGNTLWSYLVRESAGSTNILKDLSKQIAKHLANAITSNTSTKRYSKPHE